MKKQQDVIPFTGYQKIVIFILASINASLQQIAGGVAAALAGMIVVQKTKFSPIEHYDIVGYVIVAISALSIFLVYQVSGIIAKKDTDKQVVPEEVLYDV